MSYQQLPAPSRCNTCGSSVIDTAQHDVWHSETAKRVTNVEQLRRELAEESQRNALARRLADAYMAHRFTTGDTDAAFQELEAAAFQELEAATWEWRAQQKGTND